jgi:hypothetical protein
VFLDANHKEIVVTPELKLRDVTDKEVYFRHVSQRPEKPSMIPFSCYLIVVCYFDYSCVILIILVFYYFFLFLFVIIVCYTDYSCFCNCLHLPFFRSLFCLL